MDEKEIDELIQMIEGKLRVVSAAFPWTFLRRRRRGLSRNGTTLEDATWGVLGRREPCQTVTPWTSALKIQT